MTNEIIISYNGITFNSDTSSSSGYFLVDIPEGLASPEIRSNSTNRQGQHGISDQQSWYGGRTITLTGIVIGESIAQRKQLEDALINAFVLDGIQQNINSSYYDLTVDFVNEGGDAYKTSAKVLSGPDFSKDSGEGAVRNFIITLRSLNPYLESTTLKQEIVPESLQGTNFQLATQLPVQIAPQTYFIGTATNDGNFAAPLIMTISGISTNPVITNLTTGQKMELTTELTFGDEIVIDTQYGTIEKNGVDITSTLSNDSVYLKLQPGDNLLQLTDDTPESLDVTVLAQWRDARI